ncbi:transcription initiation at TATA-containing promoter protein, partial [Perkinsus olseni]
MDLRTVGERLENDPLYSSHRFEEDMNLMFSNCFLFNTPGEYAHTEGKRLKKLFDTAWRTAKERINRDSEKAPSERTARSGTRRRAPSSTVSSPQSRRSSKRGGRTQATRSTKKTAAGNKGGRKASEGGPVTSGAASSSSSSSSAFPTLFPSDSTPVAAKPADITEVTRLTANWHRTIRVIYRAVKNHSDAYVLESPVVEHPAVSMEEKVKYQKTIKRPMDLRTVEENLELFPRPIDFHNDMMLIFSNCEEFNGEKPITEMARAIERHYLKQWAYSEKDVMESYNAALALGYEPLLDLWEEWRHESPVLDLETGEVVPARRRHHGAPPQLWRVSSPPKDFQKETLEFFP